jgi:hypothetical protein
MKGAGSVLAALVASAAIAAIAPSVARAQAAPQIETQVDEQTVGLGQTVQIEMQVTSADAMPSSPRLGASAGWRVRAENASPSQTHISINGSQMDRYTLTVDWVLEAERVGAFSIGPPSAVVGGARYASHPVNVRVVPAAQAPPRHGRAAPPQMPFGFSPFDPWRQLIPGFDPNDRAPPQPQPQVTTDPKLSLDSARGDVYFLHATIDKTAPIVGEQVTLSVYQYLDTTTATDVGADDVHEPAVAEFVKHPLVQDNQEPPLAGYASIGGRIWQVRLAFRWALFPLRAGDLVIGPMSLTLVSPRGLAGQTRATETFHVHVTEPVLSGRPPAYALGDVGRFALAAQVQPRELEQGGAVGVHVELSGTGNLPNTLVPPAREGVEWLAPEVHDDLGPIAGRDAYGGKRSFEFVVRVKRAGDVNLGELALPFWDPEQKRYAVARAALGSVHVTPSVGATPGVSDPAAELLPGLPPARDRLEGSPTSAPHIDDSPLFWLGAVGGGPLAFGFAVALRHAAQRVSRARRGRRASPGAELRDRVSAARAACGGGDARAADSAISRALEAAAWAHAGVNVRGAVGDEVTERLERAGVGRQAASSLADLLRECETARFAPDEAELAAARSRWTRAQAIVRRLEKRG